MLPGSISDSDVRQWRTVVTVNGIERKIKSWDVEGELSGDLPAAVAATNGITQSTGTIEWAPQKDVSERPAHPFRPASGWIPQPGDRVEIYVSGDTASFPQFTGRVDRTTGSPRGGMSSSLVDDIDSLNVPFSYPTVYRYMPPLVDGEEYRRPQSSPMQVLMSAAAKAGYRSVAYPDNVHTMLVDAPMQGSMWPEVGELTLSWAKSASTSHPDIKIDSGWGWSMHDFNSRYAPALEQQAGTPFQISMSSATNATQGASVYLDFDSGQVVELQITDGRFANIRVDGVSILTRFMGSGVHAVMTVNGFTGEYRLWTDNGTAAPSYVDTASLSSGKMYRVRIEGSDGASVAGVTVCRPKNEAVFPSPFSPNLIPDISALYVPAGTVIRAIESSTVRDVLDEISQALLLTVYFDESGRLVMRSTDRLTSAEPARELTTQRDVLTLGWESNFLSHRTLVEVSRDVPSVSIGRYRTKVLAQGTGESLENGDTTEVILSPGADEEWIIFDEPALAWSEDVSLINSGRGSLMGASITDGTDSVWGNAYIDSAYERISHTAHKFTHTAHSVPAGNTGSLSTPSVYGGLWPKYRDYSLPVLRGSLVRFTEEVVAYAAGPVGGTVRHETKHWAGAGIIADRIVTRIVDFTTTPNPLITNCDIRFDPRLQRGDVVTIASRDYLGVVITALVMGTRVGGAEGSGHSQSISLRVLSIEATIQTLAEWNAIGPDGITMAQLNSLAAPQTLADFNTDMEA